MFLYYYSKLEWGRLILVDISVIIPTYNRPINLKRAIESVIDQTFNNWELIIVDDNNPGTVGRNETRKLVQQYSQDKRIYYVQHEQNKNGAAARNTGIKIAKGKYIAFLDDDDGYLPNKLKIQFDLLEDPRNEKYGGAYSGCYFIRNGKRIFEYNQIKSGAFLKETLACEFQMGSGSNLFIKSEIVKKLNGFDETFIRHQDYEFLVRFFVNNQLLGLKEPLFNVEQCASHLNIPNSTKSFKARMHYLAKYDYILKKMNYTDLNYIYYKNYLSLSQIAIKEKQYKLALKWFANAKKYGSFNLNDNIRTIILFIHSALPKVIKKYINRGRG